MNKRDYSNPKYKEFRDKVRQRDNATCVLCKSKKQIQVHHIRRYADSPELLTRISNGCCLCKRCHKKVTGAELFYQELLTKIVRSYG